MKRTFENTLVTIANDRCIKKIWLEEEVDETTGKTLKYKVQKSIQYKEHPDNPLNTELIDTERKN